MSESRARFQASYPGRPIVVGLTADQAATAIVSAMPEVRLIHASEAVAGLAIGIRDSIGDHRIIVTRDRDADPERDRIEADAAEYRRVNGTASSADWAALSAAEGRSGVTVPRDLYAVRVCPDCALWAANRDDSGASESWSREQYARGLDEYGPDALLTIESGEGIGFASRECDVCGALAGDRLHGTVDAIAGGAQ